MPLLFVLGGAALALGALIMPWYTVDMAAFEQALRGMLDRMLGELPQLTGGMSAADQELARQQFEQGWALGKAQAEKEIAAELVGWKVFSLPALVVSVLAALATIGAAASCWNGDAAPKDTAAKVLPLAALLAVRPVWAYLNPPTPSASDAAQLSQMGLTFPDGMISPAMGIWVALAAAVFVLVGAITLRSAEQEAEAPYVDLTAAAPAAAGVPGGPHVPLPAATAYQQAPPQPAYQQAPPQPAYQQQQAPPPGYGQQAPAPAYPQQAYQQQPQPAYPPQPPPGYGQPPQSAPPPGPYYQPPQQ